MQIGVLKEQPPEQRVALLPNTFKSLLNLSFDLLIEQGAGKGSYTSDQDYEDAGAQIASKDKVLQKADILLKINPLTPEEIEQLSEGQIIISLLQPFVNQDLVKQLKSKKVTALSLDAIPRISRAQTMDVLSSQASIAGYKATILAASYLPKYFPMMTTAAGSIPPARVLVLGAGVAGLQAIATANRLGAVVEAFDVRSEVKEEVESLGANFIEVEGAKESEAGGYAVEQSEEFKKKQQQMVQEHAQQSNVIITTAQIPGKKAPVLVKKDTVNSMKTGSVIVDLAASTGGNCEVTRENETIEHEGVTIIGNSNLPSTVSLDASRLFGKNITNLLKEFTEDGNFQIDLDDKILQGCCITHDGEVVNKELQEAIKS